MKKMFTLCVLICMGSALFAQSNFSTSLHATRAGKTAAYAKENGGMELITNIPMTDLACLKCHSTTEKYPDGSVINSATYSPSCNDCHNFATGNTVTQQTCLNCHNRQVYEQQMYPDSLATGDVHRKAGLTCMSCHKKDEMHGDGITYKSWLDPGASKTSCTECHPLSGLSSNTSHDTHAKTNKVDCLACHTTSIVSCTNCHFETLIATGKNRAMKKIKNFELLIKRNGKVTSGTFMTYTYNGKTDVIIAPFRSHLIQKNARTCVDCHVNMGGNVASIKEYNADGKITMTKWDETNKTVLTPSGVVPIPADWKTSLKFDFATYDGDVNNAAVTDPTKWRYITSNVDNIHTYYAEPLDSATLAKLGFTSFPSTVPVEMTSFTCVANGSEVKINWRTATETNNNGFEIQRRSEKEFVTIGFVKGTGTTTNTNDYSFTDKQLRYGTYAYRLKQLDYSGKLEYSSIVEVQIVQGLGYSLMQNYPNPFNPKTNIKFSLPQTCHVKLTLYDALGNIGATLVNADKRAGIHEVEFNASNLSSGIYFYQIVTPGFSASKKLLLMK
ncbi:MAG: hypothetical protein COW85_11860 [Ignavibacteria bacterium CG22_combo_CG10-13_8_21_14_all_37_15]|nr:MAG: hypothetical protein COW85_11860 [Ignavibacteria bacterium CG22_combo_CG10-13_8_21_14_all_37_15]